MIVWSLRTIWRYLLFYDMGRSVNQANNYQNHSIGYCYSLLPLSFEGVCETHVILAPGACEKGVITFSRCRLLFSRLAKAAPAAGSQAGPAWFKMLLGLGGARVVGAHFKPISSCENLCLDFHKKSQDEKRSPKRKARNTCHPAFSV